MIGIYKITNPKGHIYIGQSRNIKRRFTVYKSLYCKSQKKLYASLKKYGVKNHKFEVVCQCDVDQLNTMEQFYIILYNSFNTPHGLNLTSGGDTFEMSDETRRRIGDAGRGRIFTEERKRQYSEMMKGKKRTAEQQAKLTKAAQNRSDEYRKKISVANKGKERTDETKEKIRQNRLKQSKVLFSDKDKWRDSISNGWKERQLKESLLAINNAKLEYFIDNNRRLVCKPYSQYNVHRMAENFKISKAFIGRGFYTVPHKILPEVMEVATKITTEEIVEIINTNPKNEVKLEDGTIKLVIPKKDRHKEVIPYYN